MDSNLMFHESIRYQYDNQLNKNSIVFDLGGYEGEFSQIIYNKYESNIYIFEPIFEYFSNIIKIFNNNEKIKVYNFALSEDEKEKTIFVSGSSSNLYINKKNSLTQKIKTKNIRNFLMEKNIDNIDLIKINIEGSEYELLPYMISSGMINKFKNLQIQFHDFPENYKEKRNEIIKNLKKTHFCKLCFEYIWEFWERKND